MYIATMFFGGLGWLLILGIALVVMFVFGGIILAIGLISRYKNKKKGIKKKYPKICIIIGGILLVISIGIFGVTAITFWRDSGNEYNADTYDPHESTLAQDKQYCEEVMFDVIRCLDENDVETLESMFSVYAMELSDVHTQIEEAMDVYDGTAISCDNYSFSYSKEYTKDGYSYAKCACVKMRSVVLDTGKEYYIEVEIALVERDTEKEGIKYIKIIDCDTSEILINVGKFFD